MISIRIPRVGDDGCTPPFFWMAKEFQSTSPVWGMTAEPGRVYQIHYISIHIPRVGDDTIASQ